MSSLIDEDGSVALDAILREGRNSITEMYKELKSWINDNSTDINDTKRDIKIDSTTDINISDTNSNIDLYKSNDIVIDKDADIVDDKSYVTTPLNDVDVDAKDETSHLESTNIIQQRLTLLLKVTLKF
jgi:hypothetical protein